jgi:hypothetical protein
MPSYMLLDLWDGMTIRRMGEINAMNHSAAMLHEREVAAGKKAKTYTAKDSYPYRFDNSEKAQVSPETKELAQKLAEAGDLPPACVVDLLKWKIVTPFLVSDYD